MIADSFDVFLFDLDGVIYLDDEAIPGAVESVNRLSGMDKQIRFLTNNSHPTKEMVATRLRKLGIDPQPDEVITSGWATARHLSRQGVTTAFVVGSEGLRTELREEGIEITDDDPEVVIVGRDERVTYSDIERAARHVRQGARFVGTNPDGMVPAADGPIPGAGAIVRAVEAASGTEPTIIGKPEPLMFDIALDGLSEDARKVMIGDNPTTDIRGANRAGLTGILVAENDSPIASDRDLQPDMTISTLRDLFRSGTDT